MRLFKRLMAFCAATVLAVTMFAFPASAKSGYLTIGDYTIYYREELGLIGEDEFDGRLAYINSYSGNEQNLVIPSEIGGYIIHQIADKAFMNNTSIKTLTI